MIRRLVGPALIGCVACTEVGTDPNAVVALRFEGSAYPSIVVGDSLRDSLGALQPLVATALNYKNEPVPDVPIEFSSPDTVLRVFDDGVVFATRRTAGDAPARVFATTGSLQSQPDSLFVVHRADSIRAGKDVETVFVGTAGGTSGPDSLAFSIFGDTVAGQPKATVRSWLVSFRLRHRGQLLAPTDTTFAYTFETGGGSPPRRIATFIDTTDTQGRAARRVFVRSLSSTATEDTIYLIATIRKRMPNSAPVSAETMILLRRPSSAVTSP